MEIRKIEGKVQVYAEPRAENHGLTLYPSLHIKTVNGSTIELQMLHVPDSISLGSYRPLTLYLAWNNKGMQHFLFAIKTEAGVQTALPALRRYLETGFLKRFRKQDTTTLEAAFALVKQEGLLPSTALSRH